MIKLWPLASNPRTIISSDDKPTVARVFNKTKTDTHTIFMMCWKDVYNHELEPHLSGLPIFKISF